MKLKKKALRWICSEPVILEWNQRNSGKDGIKQTLNKQGSMTIYCFDFSFTAKFDHGKTLSKFSSPFKFQVVTDLISRLWSSSSFLTPGATETNFWESELHRSRISMPQALTSLWSSKMDTHREALGAWRSNHGSSLEKSLILLIYKQNIFQS